MIQQLSIKNFKSIKDLEMTCKKLNVIIEPNSGKSNIIEALSLQSQNSLETSLNVDIFRYGTMSDLFYDFNINVPIEVNTDDRSTILEYAIRENQSPKNRFHLYLDSKKDKDHFAVITHNGKIESDGNSGKTNVHFYEYKRLPGFSNSNMPHLAVPHGGNLPALLLSNSDFKKWVTDFLKEKGLFLTLKPGENDILVSKLVDEVLYSYPYSSLSETLQRIIFYTIALKSNKNSIILLDEPESNTFPFYTKYLAERIALDETNQFFITTHNPYLLLSLIEKSKKENINVCIASMKDYQTMVTVLNEEQITEVLDLNSDVFFNFDNILGK